MSDTKPDLDAIEARANAAAEGEWVAVHNHEAGQFEVWSPSEESYIALIGTVDDQLFIAHAREDVPALVAYARTLEAENERQRAGRDEWKAAAWANLDALAKECAHADAAEAECDRLRAQVERVQPGRPHFAKTNISWAGSGRDGDPWVMTSWDVERCECKTPWRHEALA